MNKKIQTHRDLEVYCKAFDAAMQLFDLSKRFPKEETYSLTDQVRRSSHSVCANLAEGWRTEGARPFNEKRIMRCLIRIDGNRHAGTGRLISWI